MYGLEYGASPTAWVIPIDSARYHRHAGDISVLIDSLYQVQPLLSQKSYGTFVFPDNFVEINYKGGDIVYEDSITYNIDFLGKDSLSVTIFNNDFTQLSFPKDSIINLSPKDIRIFIQSLERRYGEE